MNPTATEQTSTASPTVRLAFYAACVASAVLFGWVFAGWLGPADPLSSVAFVNHAHPWLMALLIAAISLPIAGVTSYGLGAVRPYAGVVAVAVGWATLRVRFAGMQTFVFDWAPLASGEAGRRLPFMVLWLETLGWIAVSLAIVMFCRLIERRRAATNPSPPVSVGGWWELRRTVLCAAVAIIVICIAGGPVIEHAEAGQALFVIALGFFLGGLVGLGIKPPTDPAWCLLAVPIVPLIGYGLAWYRPGLGMPFSALADPLPNPLAKALPIDYLAAGMAGCVLAYWLVISRRESASS
jgi:hypothetical protein